MSGRGCLDATALSPSPHQPLTCARPVVAIQSAPYEQYPLSILRPRLRRSPCAGHVDIHDNARDTVNTTGSEFASVPECEVTNAAREFNNPVMYLDANCAGNDILIMAKLDEDVLLNLNVVLHQAVPSWLSDIKRMLRLYVHGLLTSG